MAGSGSSSMVVGVVVVSSPDLVTAAARPEQEAGTGRSWAWT